MALLGPDFVAARHKPLLVNANPRGPLVSLGLGLLLLVISLLLQFGMGSLIRRTALNELPGVIDEQVLSVLIGMFPAALIVAALALWIAGRKGSSAREVLNLRLPALGAAGYGLVIGGFVMVMAVLLIALAGLVQVFGSGPPDQGMLENFIGRLSQQPAIFGFVVPGIILGAPLSEELIFRGQLFTGLAQGPLGYRGAAVVSSAAWAILHYTGQWLQVGSIFLMGLVLCWILRRYGSLWITMVCHALWNSMTVLAVAGAAAS